MINLLVAKLLLYLCGSLGSFLVILLCFEYSEREQIKHYYFFLVLGFIGCVYMIFALFLLEPLIQ